MQRISKLRKKDMYKPSRLVSRGRALLTRISLCLCFMLFAGSLYADKAVSSPMHTRRVNTDSIFDPVMNPQLSWHSAQHEYEFLQQINKEIRLQYFMLFGILLLFISLAVVLYVTSRKQEREQMERIAQLQNEVAELRMSEQLKQMEANEQTAPRKHRAGPPKKGYDITMDKEQANQLFLTRATELVHRHMAHGMLTIEVAASAMGMSISTFRRRVVAITGESPKTFFLTIQMDEAARKLLEQPYRPLKLIADECGYTEVASFVRTFKHVKGVTPTEYREQEQQTTQQTTQQT